MGAGRRRRAVMGAPSRRRGGWSGAAACRLIREDFKITREHGQWVRKSGVWMTALYHPAAILRDPSKRPDTFQDLKGLQAKIREVCERTY